MFQIRISEFPILRQIRKVSSSWKPLCRQWMKAWEDICSLTQFSVNCLVYSSRTSRFVKQKCRRFPGNKKWQGFWFFPQLGNSPTFFFGGGCGWDLLRGDIQQKLQGGNFVIGQRVDWVWGWNPYPEVVLFSRWNGLFQLENLVRFFKGTLVVLERLPH